MNMQTSQPTKIKVRRANNNALTAGQHYTLTRVENTPDRMFAFAISDDGTEEIYVPAPIVRKEQMTMADVGAGFTCMVRRQERYDGEGGHPHALMPIKWDGEAEEIEVDDPAALNLFGNKSAQPAVDPQLGDDLDELGNATDGVLGHSSAVEDAIADIAAQMDKLRTMKTALEALLKDMKETGKILDRVCPQLDE